MHKKPFISWTYSIWYSHKTAGFDWFNKITAILGVRRSAFYPPVRKQGPHFVVRKIPIGWSAGPQNTRGRQTCLCIRRLTTRVCGVSVYTTSALSALSAGNKKYLSMAYTLIISIPKIFVNGQCSTSTYHQKRGHIILQCVYVAIVFANGILVENRCQAPIPVCV